VSEIEVIKKARSTLVTAPAEPASSPRILTSTVAARQAVSERDELRQLAMRLGLTDEDIRYCYETRDSYDWCLVLLGAKDTPPSSPISPNLNSLIMRLLIEGKVDPQRMRALGLSKYLSNLVVEKLSNIVERAKSEVAEHRKPELANEIDKVQRMYRGLARVSEPVLEREILKMVAEKCSLPPRAEEVVLSIIKGRVQPVSAVESLINALRKPEKQEEKAVAEKTARRAPPVGEGAPGRAQSPRGG
jgi:hypothetical protein